MRAIIALGLLSLLTACSGKPSDYGITGPGVTPPPTVSIGPTPDTSNAPGVTTSGSSYGPSNRPTSGSGGFWGYN